MLTRKALDKLLNSFLDDLIASGYSPSKVILFGSYISGGIHQHSDIDIAIWADFNTGVSMDDYENLKPILKKYRKIDAKLYPAYANAVNFDPFIHIIESTGKVIYDMNKTNKPALSR